jgi:predicted NBD/HSP70 family sugar kinase
MSACAEHHGREMARHLRAARQRQVLQEIWRTGGASLSELHEKTGLRPNTLGEDLGFLLQAGVLRPREKSVPRGRGRPRVPLEIDPSRRHVVGLALRRGSVETGTLDLLGQRLTPPATVRVADPARLVAIARRLLEERLDARTAAIGVSIPGFVDSTARSVLSSPVWPGRRRFSLASLYEAAAPIPLALENDLHALAARWQLERKGEPRNDVLLVHLDDGQLGSALLVDGRPNRGCVTAANELGHVRLPVATEVCFCGRTGCLERIFSTPFLRRQTRSAGRLTERCEAYTGHGDTALEEIVRLLAMGLGGAVNFSRVNRLVLVSPLLRHAPFAEALVSAVRREMLDEIARRVEVDVWEQPVLGTAETAGWLALAGLYYTGWHPAADPLACLRPLKGRARRARA